MNSAWREPEAALRLGAEASLARERLEAIWRAGVAAAGGYVSVAAALAGMPDLQPTHLLAIGKAAPSMAAAALAARPALLEGLAISRRGHFAGLTLPPKVACLEAAHPIPDGSSLRAGEAALDFVSSVPRDGALLCLVSGGASALVEVLREGASLADLQALNRLLLSQALDIEGVNARRRELSLIKGGGLLRALGGSRVAVLAISDVRGDAIDVIGSGIGDPSLCPAAVRSVAIVASNRTARLTCRREAERLGLPVVADEERLYGEVGEVAEALADRVAKGPHGLYVFGGEPTVNLPDSPGEGGRNQALAAELARRFDSGPGAFALAAGTDGGDGPGEAAGGFVSAETWRAVAGGGEAIRAADTGSWLRRAGGLFVTGPTGTNVMDLALVLKTG